MEDLILFKTTEEVINDLLNIVEDLIERSRLFLQQLEENKNISQDGFDTEIYKLNQLERKVKELKKEKDGRKKD